MKRMDRRMKRIAIFGATGYTGFELIRMLLSHPGARIEVLTSEQYSAQPLEQAFPPFKGKLQGVSFGKMERLLSAEFDVAFLALPHTVSSSVAGPLLSRGVPVIDLSADFRFRSIPLYESVYGVAHKSPAIAGKAVYGLPEIHRAGIRKTRLAAVPGCFPTSVILGLYPLLAEGLVDRKGIVADCKTGVSGGGRGAGPGLPPPGGGGGGECGDHLRPAPDPDGPRDPGHLLRDGEGEGDGEGRGGGVSETVRERAVRPIAAAGTASVHQGRSVEQLLRYRLAVGREEPQGGGPVGHRQPGEGRRGRRGAMLQPDVGIPRGGGAPGDAPVPVSAGGNGA